MKSQSVTSLKATLVDLDSEISAFDKKLKELAVAQGQILGCVKGVFRQFEKKLITK